MASPLDTPAIQFPYQHCSTSPSTGEAQKQR